MNNMGMGLPHEAFAPVNRSPGPPQPVLQPQNQNAGAGGRYNMLANVLGQGTAMTPEQWMPRGHMQKAYEFYNQALNRNPTVNDMSYWMQQQIPRDQMTRALIGGAQGTPDQNAARNWANKHQIDWRSLYTPVPKPQPQAPPQPPIQQQLLQAFQSGQPPPPDIQQQLLLGLQSGNYNLGLGV